MYHDRKNKKKRIFKQLVWINLLCFKLTFASPVERAMTAPKENNEENGVDLDGGDAGSIERALKIDIRIQAVM